MTFRQFRYRLAEFVTSADFGYYLVWFWIGWLAANAVFTTGLLLHWMR
jgi:hypothetical protein